MPDGIYFNALKIEPDQLAMEMNDMIRNRMSYYDMFRWHNYYKYHDPLSRPTTSGVCHLCAKLNDRRRKKEKTVYKNITKWFIDGKD